MTPLTNNLTLSPDSSVDLHMHTTFSDGRWPAQQLIDYLVAEGFDLIAVTDHDRVDTVAGIQELAAEKHLPVLAGVEVSTRWQGKMGHMLCYGFDPEHNDLYPLTQQVVRLQLENTYEVNATLRKQGYEFPRQQEVLVETGGELRRPIDNATLLFQHNYTPSLREGLAMIKQAGFYSVMADMAETVEAAHRSGAVCLIAHPGRQESGFTFYDPSLLDQLRAEIPIDGIEVYHPYHSQDTVQAYEEYVCKHHLLYSAGSDSHSQPGRMPIKHRAAVIRPLLERLGISVR